jgi:hypothetical protein
MRRALVRSGLIGTALCSIVVISFPSFSSTAGLNVKPQAVERAHKGDRLAIAPPVVKTDPRSQPTLVRSGNKVPMGCDRAFSSMSSPEFLGLYGRCAV